MGIKKKEFKHKLKQQQNVQLKSIPAITDTVTTLNKIKMLETDLKILNYLVYKKLH